MITLQISSGRGPTEARVFVRLLALRLAAGLGVEVSFTGDPSAPISASLLMSRASGEPWVGTHALLAPLRGRGRRKRWFVDVRIFEEAAAIGPADPVLTAARAGGPGGQNVNRRATAVRAVDRNSGVSVRASDARSQAQNRALALSRLDARLAARYARAEGQERAQRRAAHDAIIRGQAAFIWRLGAGGLEI